MRIDVKGPIINDSDQWIYDWFGIPATSPSKVAKSIQQAVKNQDSELVVAINSGGGSVFSASEIYTELKSFQGSVKIKIVGMAASAASVISMAGHVEMSPTAQLMIHNASTSSWGDYRDMDDTSDFLQKVNQSIINAYATKTNKSNEELKAMMDKTTWMTAQEALENGFIDAIMFEKEVGATASMNIERPELINGVLPQEVIDKVRETLAKDPSKQTTNSTSPAQNKGVDNEMNMETLKNEHPELFNAVKNIGIEEGTKAENARIQAIEDIAMPGNETMITAAKFTEPITAEQLAINMIKAEKEKGQNFTKNLKDDALPLNDVPGSNTPDPTKNATDKECDELKNMWEV